MKLKSHDLRTPEGQLASALEFQAGERQKAQDAGLWYEIRYWYQLPEGHNGTPSHWQPITYAFSRSSAGIVAESLWRERQWYCEVWSCTPVSDPDIPPISHDPVPWHLVDTQPPYWKEEYKTRPKSGNPGESPR